MFCERPIPKGKVAKLLRVLDDLRVRGEGGDMIALYKAHQRRKKHDDDDENADDNSGAETMAADAAACGGGDGEADGGGGAPAPRPAAVGGGRRNPARGDVGRGAAQKELELVEIIDELPSGGLCNGMPTLREKMKGGEGSGPAAM